MKVALRPHEATNFSVALILAGANEYKTLPPNALLAYWGPSDPGNCTNMTPMFQNWGESTGGGGHALTADWFWSFVIKICLAYLDFYVHTKTFLHPLCRHFGRVISLSKATGVGFFGFAVDALSLHNNWRRRKWNMFQSFGWWKGATRKKHVSLYGSHRTLTSFAKPQKRLPNTKLLSYVWPVCRGWSTWKVNKQAIRWFRASCLCISSLHFWILPCKPPLLHCTALNGKSDTERMPRWIHRRRTARRPVIYT